jgi:hypothetical protein
MLLQQRGNKHLGVEGAHHELNLGHRYGNCFELPLVMVHTLRPILIMKTYQWFQMQHTTIFSNIGWSNATILQLVTILQLYYQLMQLYATICNLCNYMQLYATCNNFVCNYMQLCNMPYVLSLKTYMQLYANRT